MVPLYFIYIDESGGNLLEPRQHFFVLAATAIKVDECMAIQEKVAKLKQEYFPEIRAEEIEVKGYCLEQAKKFFKHVRLEVRREIVKRLLELLMAHDISLFATVLSKRAMFNLCRQLNTDFLRIVNFWIRSFQLMRSAFRVLQSC